MNAKKNIILLVILVLIVVGISLLIKNRGAVNISPSDSLGAASQKIGGGKGKPAPAPAPVPTTYSCVDPDAQDTDGGISRKTSISVYDGQTLVRTLSDACVSNTQLSESSCASAGGTSQGINCSCSEGACIGEASGS